MRLRAFNLTQDFAMTPTIFGNRTSWHNRCQAKYMRRSVHNTIVLACVVIAAAATASARTFPLEKITRGTQEFFGTVSYDVEKAYAGNHNLELLISLSTKDTAALELTKLEPPEQTQIQFKEMSNDGFVDPATGLRTSEYKYLADIPEGTEPRIYLITVSFASPGEKNINRTFWLYAGVRNKGKLTVVTDTDNAIQFFTGTGNKYQLQLENNFPDYAVNIKNVTIRSDPSGLIESQTVDISNMSIDPAQRGVIDLDLKTAPMSFTNLLSGFSDSTRLKLDVTYDDGYGRSVTDLSQSVKIKIRPRDRVLVVAMLIGVVIGAILKLYLQRLQQQGVITRREVFIAVTITSLIGLVVSFIAVVGRIKIIAFDQMGSYDNPAVIFVISLAGAVGGAQLLSTFFKASSSSAAGTSPPTPAAAKPASTGGA
jgi:hypothetical protein